MPTLINAMNKLAQRAELDPRLSMIYIPLRGGIRAGAPAEDTFPLISESLRRLKTHENSAAGKNIRTLLLLGDSGMGKTCVCLKMAELFWKRWKRQGIGDAAFTDNAATVARSERIPLYIHLTEFKSYLHEGLLEHVLIHLGLTAEESLVIRAMPLLLMLDGFDEVNISHQIYRSQGWDRLGYDIKVIICSRPDGLAHKNQAALFQVSALSQQMDYEIIHLQTFSDKQISDYLRHYIASHIHENARAEDSVITSASTSLPDKDSTKFSVWEAAQDIVNAIADEAIVTAKLNETLIWLERLPSLKALVRTPFLLAVAAKSLPSIVQSLTREGTQLQHVSNLVKAEAMQFTQNQLFEIFLKQWFLEQAVRVKRQGLFDGKLTTEEVAAYMQAYAQNLAASLLGDEGQLDERGLSEEECLRPELIEPVYHRSLLARYNHRDLKLRQSELFFKVLLPRQMHTHSSALGILQSMDYDTDYEQPLVLASSPGERELLYYQRDSARRVFRPIKHITIYENHLRAIQSGCLLRRLDHPGRERFMFLHKSIIEYLAYRELIEGVLGTYDHYLDTLLSPEQRARGLNRVLLTREPNILESLANDVLKAECHINGLACKDTIPPQLPSQIPLVIRMRNGEVFQFPQYPVPDDINYDFYGLGMSRRELYDVLRLLDMLEGQSAVALASADIVKAMYLTIMQGRDVSLSNIEEAIDTPDDMQQQEIGTMLRELKTKILVCLMSEPKVLTKSELSTSEIEHDFINNRVFKNKVLPKPQLSKTLHAQLPNGEVSQFIERAVASDGDCGFHSLGITRYELHTALIHMNTPTGRHMLASEIIDAFLSFEQGGNGLLAPEAWSLLRSQRETEQQQVDDLMRTIKGSVRNHLWQGLPQEAQATSALFNTDMLASEFLSWLEGYDANLYHYLQRIENFEAPALVAWLPEAPVVISDATKLALRQCVDALQTTTVAETALCETEAIYYYYINGFINECRLWLGVKSALLYAEYKQFALQIWQKITFSSRQLQLIGDYAPSTGSEIVTHILYTGDSTHFNRLDIYHPAPIQLLSMEEASSPTITAVSEANLDSSESEPQRLSDLLFAIIDVSKEKKGIAIAAANAITILNRAGVDFTGRDFANIQIPGADLTGGVFRQTNFNGANLAGVRFHQAYLAEATWAGANVAGVDFGERTYWEMPSVVTCLTLYQPTVQTIHWLVGCHDGFVYRYDDSTGRMVHQYRHQSYNFYHIIGYASTSVTALAVHAPDHRMVTGGADNLIWLWSLVSHHALRKLEGHSGIIRSLLMRQSGWLASGSDDTTIRIWRSNGAPDAVFRGHTASVTSLVIDPSSALGELRLGISSIDPSSAALGELSLGISSMLTNLNIDASWLVSGSEDGSIRRWLWLTMGSGDNVKPLRYFRLFNGRPGLVIPAHLNWVSSLAVSADGMLISGSDDKTIRFWGKPKIVLEGHTDDVTSLAVSPDGWLISGSRDRTIRFWHIDDGTPGPILRGHVNDITSLAIDPNGWLASGSYDHTIRFWRLEDRLTPESRGHTRDIVSLIVTTCGGLVSASADGTIRFWAMDGNPGPVLRGHTSGVRDLTISQDDWLVSADLTTIRLWHLPDGKPGPVLLELEGTILCLTMGLDGWLVFAGDADGAVYLWKLDGIPGPVLRGHTGRVLSLVISEDKWLITGGHDRSIRFWRMDGTPGPVFQGHTGLVSSLVVTSDSVWLVSGSYDSTIRLWRMDGSSSRVLGKHAAPVSSLAISAYGWLASGGCDGNVGIWMIPSCRLLHVLSMDFQVTCLTVSEHGHELFVGGVDGHMVAIDLRVPQLPRTRWMHVGNPKLVLKGLNLSEAIHLSETNQILCRQRGAVGKPNPSNIYQPRCNLFKELPGTGHIDPQHPLIKVNGQTAGGQEKYLLNENNWTVSIARSTSQRGFSFAFWGSSPDDHAFLIIEGIKNYRRFIIRAELTYDSDTAHADIHLKPLDDLDRFQKKAAEGIEAYQIKISAEMGHQLLHNIQADQQKPMYYKATGANLFTQSDEIETHSCLTWCRKQLALIGHELPTRWYHFIVTLPSDVTAPQEAPSSSNKASSSSTQTAPSVFRG